MRVRLTKAAAGRGRRADRVSPRGARPGGSGPSRGSRGAPGRVARGGIPRGGARKIGGRGGMDPLRARAGARSAWRACAPSLRRALKEAARKARGSPWCFDEGVSAAALSRAAAADRDRRLRLRALQEPQAQGRSRAGEAAVDIVTPPGLEPAALAGAAARAQASPTPSVWARDLGNTPGNDLGPGSSRARPERWRSATVCGFASSTSGPSSARGWAACSASTRAARGRRSS